MGQLERTESEHAHCCARFWFFGFIQWNYCAVLSRYTTRVTRLPPSRSVPSLMRLFGDLCAMIFAPNFQRTLLPFFLCRFFLRTSRHFSALCCAPLLFAFNAGFLCCLWLLLPPLPVPSQSLPLTMLEKSGTFVKANESLTGAKLSRSGSKHSRGQ